MYDFSFGIKFPENLQAIYVVPMVVLEHYFIHTLRIDIRFFKVVYKLLAVIPSVKKDSLATVHQARKAPS